MNPRVRMNPPVWMIPVVRMNPREWFPENDSQSMNESYIMNDS